MWREATRKELADQRSSLKLIASRELRLAGRAADDGHLVQRQVRRGHGRPPLLRGLPERRHRRGARRRARPRAVRCAVRLRAAALRHRRQPGRVLVDPRQPGRDARRSSGSVPRTSTSSPRPTGSSCATSSATSACSGMALDAGGHLTHGFRPNISGKMFHQQQYGTDPETGLLDYDVVAAKAREFKPLVLVAGYSAYPRRVNFAKMREIADEVGAVLMVDMAHFAGLVAGKVFTGDEDPVPYAHVTTTTTHKSLRGPRGGLVLAQEEFAGRRRPRLPDGARRSAVARDGRQGRGAGRGAAARRSRPTPRTSPTTPSRWPRASSRAARRWSPAAPTTTSCCSTCRRTASPAGRPSRRCSTPASSPTATRCRSDPNGAWYTSGIRLRHARADHPRLRPRRVRHGRRPGRTRCSRTPTPGTNKAGAPSKATYKLADGVADRVHARAQEMLDSNPLYPGLELA